MVKKLKVVKARVNGLRMKPRHKPEKRKTTTEVGGYWRKKNWVSGHIRHLKR